MLPGLVHARARVDGGIVWAAHWNKQIRHLVLQPTRPGALTTLRAGGNQCFRDIPGGTVVKNPPAGDMGSSPGPGGRSHMRQSN